MLVTYRVAGTHAGMTVREVIRRLQRSAEAFDIPYARFVVACRTAQGVSDTYYTLTPVAAAAAAAAAADGGIEPSLAELGYDEAKLTALWLFTH